MTYTALVTNHVLPALSIVALIGSIIIFFDSYYDMLNINVGIITFYSDFPLYQQFHIANSSTLLYCQSLYSSFLYMIDK